MPEFEEVKDSGERQQWDTGSQRDSQQGKGRFDLIPFLPIERLAQHFENGAKKYDDDNWKKGQNLRQYVNSLMRHAYKMSEGWLDEDHAAAVMWNAAAFIWTKDAIDRGVLPAELDDIPWTPDPEANFYEEPEEEVWLTQGPTLLRSSLGPITLPDDATVGEAIAMTGLAGTEYPARDDDYSWEPTPDRAFVDFYAQQSTGEGLEVREEADDAEEVRAAAAAPYSEERAARKAAMAFLSDDEEWDPQHPIAHQQLESLMSCILSWDGLNPEEIAAIVKVRYPDPSWPHNPEDDAPK